VTPVMAEMIRNGDGEQKGLRTCGGEAVAAEAWRSLPASQTDPAGGRFVFPRAVLPAGVGSGLPLHIHLQRFDASVFKETVDHSEGEELIHREWNGRCRLGYTCRRVNGAPIRYERNEEDAISVNYYRCAAVDASLSATMKELIRDAFPG
jgi:hypothetical protein